MLVVMHSHSVLPIPPSQVLRGASQNLGSRSYLEKHKINAGRHPQLLRPHVWLSPFLGIFKSCCDETRLSRKMRAPQAGFDKLQSPD